jgi:type VII secretion protein EccB
VQTQKDRVHAYQFLIGRMASALVSGNPSPAEPPDRGHRLGLYSGLVLGVLVAVGFWVYGLIVPGGNDVWQEKGVIIVEEETGNRYVYQDGALRPTLNQASAMLVQGQGARVEMVSRSSMSGLPHGAPIGITAAPDTVPAAGDLLTGPWLLCLTSPTGESPTMSMVLDLGHTGARPNVVEDDRYVLVQSAEGRRYLVLRGVKYELGNSRVPVALGLPAVEPVPAPDVWLAALRDGPMLAAVDIPDAGEDGPAVAGVARVVGDVFRQQMSNGSEQFYVLRADGLAPMSRTEFALMSARDPSTTPIDVTAPAVAAAPVSADNSLRDRLPDMLAPKMIEGTDINKVCLMQSPYGVSVVSGLVTVSQYAAAWPIEGSNGAAVPPNKGMLAAAVPLEPGQKKPHRYLITDRGIKYPVLDDASVNALGYAGVPPTPVDADVLAALPTGPALSRAAVGVSEKG